eukprot:TRINITY_DN30_c0_g2_i1.p3 TRINITY_DN30_c0_g2~~TRINITY_DN30_c0_g2_i1.p3  ORF type:complete len:175 (+),score=19.78 TRINITY_DN30_c0_g2_i1:1895-2419(+)
MYLVKHVLARNGARAVTANRAEDALEKFKAATDFDAIITDLRMPGMSGQEFILEVRKFEKAQNRKPMFIIVLTAESDPEERLLCLSKYGANEYLLKPIYLNDLMQALYKAGQETVKRKLHILVVDDENMSTYTISKVLTDDGHSVVVCGSINEVIRIAQQSIGQGRIGQRKETT